MGPGIEFLVAKAQDMIGEESRVDLLDLVVSNRSSKVDARYLCAQRTGDRTDVNLLALRHGA